MLGQDLIGRRFKRQGVTFTVLEVKAFPAAEVGERFKELLNLEEGKLSAIRVFGHLVPNFTYGRRGVAKLAKIEIKGQKISKASAIADALGIHNDLRGYAVEPV